MQEATLAGNGHKVARLCHVMGTAVASWSTVSMTPSMIQRRPVTDAKSQVGLVSRVIHHQCGFKGRQVGEATFRRTKSHWSDRTRGGMSSQELRKALCLRPLRNRGRSVCVGRTGERTPSWTISNGTSPESAFDARCSASGAANSGASAQELPSTPQTLTTMDLGVSDKRCDRTQGIPGRVVQGGTPQMLHRQVRAAQILVQELSPRVGSFPGRIVREQRCSLLNVPLMWAVAGQEPSTPVLDWLIHHCQFSRDQFQWWIGRSGRSSDDWVDVTATRSWGITTEQDLSAWLRRQGFPSPRPGNHMSARAQEFVLAEACRLDARVAMLEVVFVTTTLEFGRDDSSERTTERDSDGFCTRRGEIMTRPDNSQFGFLRQRGFGVICRASPNVEKLPPLFLTAVAQQFQGCHRAEGEGDELAEDRAWKLHGTRSVGRDELAARGQLSRQLLASARNALPTRARKRQSARSEEERRGTQVS